MRIRRALNVIVGLLVAAGFLFLLFRGTRWPDLTAAMRDVNPAWLLVGQLMLWATYFARAQRWSYVVRAVQPVSFRTLFSATQIGFMVNFAVPARLGEVVRAYALSRLGGLSMARSMSMVALERVNDVIGLLAVVLVAGFALASDVTARIPAGAFGNEEVVVLSSGLVRAAGWLLAGTVVAALMGLVLLYVRQQQVVGLARRIVAPVSTGLAERVASLLAGFAEGMHVFRSAWDQARAVFWSLIVWAAEVASVAAVLAAFGITFPWYTPFVMITLIGAVIVFPLAPGVVGQYHVAAVAGLLMAAPGVDPARAKAVAIVEHLFMLIPVAALGLYCLRREGLTLVELVGRRARWAESAAVKPRPSA